jgi:hypothetical protein
VDLEMKAFFIALLSVLVTLTLLTLNVTIFDWQFWVTILSVAGIQILSFFWGAESCPTQS